MKTREMKIAMSILCMALSIVVHAADYDFVVDGIYYHYRTSDKTASVATRSGFQTTIPYYEGNVVVPAQVNYNGRTMNVTEVEHSAFYYSKNLLSVTLPNTVKKIGTGAFSECKGLKSVVLADAITEIADNMFSGCASLTDVEIPSSVVKIGGHVFEGCTSLKSISIPNSVTQMEGSVFKDCTALENIVLSEGLVGVSSYCFQNCAGLRSVHLPTSGKLQYVGSHSFENCTGLTVISLPRGVRVDNAAFYQCTNVHKLVLGEESEGTGSITFADYKYNNQHPLGGCQIDTICYRYNVTMAGQNIFYNSDLLKVLYIGGEHPLRMYRFGENIEKVYAMFPDPTVSACIFPDKVYVNATLYVPKGTKEKYMAASGWENFFNVVETDYDTAGIPSLSLTGSEIQRYYDLNGRRTEKLQPGVNIVRYNDGKTKKVLVK